MRPTQHARRASLTLAAALACSAISSSSWAADHFCDTNQEFIDALNNSAPGDTITLDATTTFTAPAGGFILPQKTGSSYITIRSSNLSSLPPEGVRIQPSDAANMPDIRPPAGTSRAMWTAAPPQSVAHHWKLVGIEFIGAANNSTSDWALLEIGNGTTAQNTEQLIPHHFIVDRCYFHDNSPTQGLHQVVTVHGNYVDIINSNISGAKRNDKETQCIYGANCAGPINIINNYLEGAGENVMFGGGPSRITDVQPQNIVIRRNYFYKPNSWKYGHAEYDNMNWHVKNHLEFKCGRYITIDSNIFDNCWADAGSQHGTSLSFKTSRTSGQGSPWFTTEDITITNNIVRNVGLGFTIASSVNADGSDLYGYPRNVTIRNNLVHDVSSAYPDNTGEQFRFGSGSPNVTIDHNTMFQSGTSSQIAEIWGPTLDNHVYTNNMWVYSSGDTFRSGAGDGEGCFNVFYVNGFVYKRNVIKSAISSEFLPNYHGDWAVAPYSNNLLAFPTSWGPQTIAPNGVLVDFANPGTDYAGWKVAGWDQPTNVSQYPYNNAGANPDGSSDGKDIGCDIDAVVAATAGCISGVWPDSGSNPIATESLDYAAPGNLNNQTGGSGFGTNAWTAVSGQANPAVAADSLTYSDGTKNLTTDGNKLQMSNTSRSWRNFDSAIVTNTATTKWVSFRAKYTFGGTPPSNHAGFSLFAGTGATVTEIFFGKPGGETNWGVDHSTTIRTTSSTFQPDAFLVYKLVFTGSQVTISMWVNPDLDESLLGTSDITPLTKAHTTNISSLRISTGSNATGFEFDEFRIGNTFADVTPTGNGDIVLYASKAPTKFGNWVAQSDVDAAGGMKMRDPNTGAAKVNDPLANPAHYFEMTFNAQAGVGYRLWMRMEADSNNWANDSVHVQFDKSDNASGTNVYRIGTTDGTWVSLEEYTNQGVQNWGWSDNGHGALDTPGPLIYFETAGQQTIRVQRRDDGVAIDQIVLSPVTYLNARPGPQKNDTTILPEQN